MEDKVDILLTTYNTNLKYLKLQLNSILNQTHKNFSLIISDDCSTNNEVKNVLEEYEKKDNRIKLYFQSKNLGYTKNFEFVLTKSTANYIAFSDHDDIWYPNKIEECLKILKEKDVDLVYCDANQIDENGNILHKSYLKYKNMPIINEKSNYNKGILAFSRHIAIGCSQLFTKKVKEKLIPFTKNTMAHDWNSVYIASKLKGFYCIDKQLFGYRLHGNNAFGGRSFKQNVQIWKQKYGRNYNSYLKFRHHAITDTYLAGTLMCKEYSKRIENNKLKKQEEKVINYFENAQKHKIIYFPIHKYFEYLAFKGIKRRAVKEIAILHFPLISYIVFSLIS
ncbi:MAG: glycosyltransferase [Clostridia bacterium]